MDKFALISMFITFATSNDVLKFEPHNTGQVQSHNTGQVLPNLQKPKFCKSLDCPAYKVIQTTKDFEVREYYTSNWVSTNLTGISYKDASSMMFMKLFGYISGQNEKKQKIAMTAPVTNRIIPAQGPACESDFIMSFYVSSKVRDIPEPSNKEVYLDTKQKQIVYVRQFSGFTYTFEAWSKHATELADALDAKGIKYEKSYYYTAGYDSPFTLLNRHNEIWFVPEQK
ncbi:heme-binding protein 2-like [Ruditapes philippinarum]|uniref:heme-binding protein 2-like n=1 Tax=Ruditapes philippinarum TaxID=129788 RepID=UPI00295BCCB3|nr:heme-binding protein 2-like [Ruditapes philippinarum]